MLKGRPDLCRYMPRPKDARRTVADPDNEPNFYNISLLYPLSDDEETKTTEQEERDEKADSSEVSALPPQTALSTLSPMMNPTFFLNPSSAVPPLQLQQQQELLLAMTLLESSLGQSQSLPSVASTPSLSSVSPPCQLDTATLVLLALLT